MDKLKKPLLIGCGCALAICAIILAANLLKAPTPTTRDLAAINGCPELNNVIWGMSCEEVTNATSLEFTTEESELDTYITSADTFKIYTVKAVSIQCAFRSDHLYEVLFSFDPTKTANEDITALVTSIYGQPTEGSSWLGTNTAIHIEQTDSALTLRYTRTASSQFYMLSTNSQDATNIDPFALTGEGSLFGHIPSIFTANMLEGIDYIANDHYLYTIYTLYPSFEYMGLPAGHTAIELHVPALGSTVKKAGYAFVLDANSQTVISEIIENCTLEYGFPDKYISTTLTGNTSKETILTKEEFYQHMNSGNGILRIVWNGSEYTVTLDMTLSADSPYSYTTLLFEKR